ncbi:MAG: tocopherol cyclase family protein [Phaeodactylibacter sp.]|uniref:tocopherol cyclase family protein n=1 Tax=Phaeodactylibacter sp. TaxID=1940289 RepID=UPI0032EE44DC
MQHLPARWKALWNPNRYHGWGKSRNYFEGWYFKIVSPCERYAFALIPGISMDEQGQQHAFIQRLDGKACTAAYHEFASAAFQPRPDRFEVQLGTNLFSEHRLKLALPELEGELSFHGNTPWPSKPGAPGIMGWYTFVPFMECYHGVVSLHHELRGHLNVYGKPVDFTGGLGYIEKDWGKSFPSSWIWMQANHLQDTKQACLMASVAKIPWLGSHFTGFLAGLQLDGKLWAFTTYNNARLQTSLDEPANTVHLRLKRKGAVLEIDAQQRGGTGTLAAPVSGAMAGKVNESLQSVIHIRLKEGRTTVYEGEARHAGLEVAGPVQEELV